MDGKQPPLSQTAGRVKILGMGCHILTALLSNLVWKGSRNVVSYSLYTEREKNSGKTGAAPAGRRGTRPWEVDGLLQIGICDDARESRFQLRVLLERALEGRSAPARLLEFSSGDALLGWMDRHAGELDLVFLDIEMEGTNGMDTARALREADHSSSWYLSQGT